MKMDVVAGSGNNEYYIARFGVLSIPKKVTMSKCYTKLDTT